MGDTFHDPTDHMRTTRQHAGRAVIDVLTWPGYSLLIVGLMTGVGSLVAFATGHDRQGVTIAVIAVIAALVGVVWLAAEHRRVGRVAQQWRVTHPEERHSHRGH